MSNRWLGSADVPRGNDYDARFTALEQTGQDVHGEAHFVTALGVSSVLDAGCGTGRVAIELARRGLDVVGVDLDAAMLAVARRKAPHLPWYEGDLATLELAMPDTPLQRRLFDAIVLAGNVMIFLAPGSEATVVTNLARHLAPGGASGRRVSAPPRWPYPGALRHLHSAGRLSPGRALGDLGSPPWEPRSDYAVSVHRRLT